MTPGALLYVALGGAIGSAARAVIAAAIPSRFPWAILLINVTGSLIIGWLMTRAGGWEPAAATRWQALLAVGFCGGFTTFSTFSWQTFEQLLQGRWFAAAANIVLSVGLCLAATWAGYRLARA